MRIGRHTSKSGSYERAILRIKELGGNTLQVFSTSPRIWRASTPDAADVRNLHLAREKYDITPLVVHDSYLINLASQDDKIRTSSVAAFRSEIERCIAIGAEHLVAHPGNYKGQSLEEGLLAVVEGLVQAAAGLSSHRLTILLENTVGAGAQLGSRFEELEVIRQLAQDRMDIGIGFCLDTCHCFASGHYNVAESSGLADTLHAAETILSIDKVRVIHCNDSKGNEGSKLDRHENIGEGKIGLEAFSRIVNHPKLRDKAFILETPAETPAEEKKDIETLKSLYKQPKGAKRGAKSIR